MIMLTFGYECWFWFMFSNLGAIELHQYRLPRMSMQENEKLD